METPFEGGHGPQVSVAPYVHGWITSSKKTSCDLNIAAANSLSSIVLAQSGDD